jgi:uncharacterized membrane protein
MYKLYNMIKTVAIAAITMLLLDGLYLNAIGTQYGEQVAKVQRTAMNIKMSGVVACYIFLIVGLYYFILKENRSMFDAFLLGIVIYGVYDATTYAIFKHWSPVLAITDTLWGGILFALTTAVVYYLA